ncbi:MAG: EVE domain-containing protein, partial [Patescibacteria group bacterium]
GYMQSQGDEAHLSRMQQDDWIIFYSPREDIAGTKKLQTFTAIGQLPDEEIYSLEIDGVKVFRRKVTYTQSKEVSVLPLIQKLSFIRNKKHWGFIFKLSLIQILEEDFNIIKMEMIQE